MSYVADVGMRALVALMALTGLAAQGSPQRWERVFVVLVDDQRYAPAEVEGAAQLMTILQNEVLRDADLISVVSTGRSSVETDLRYASQRRNLDEAIRKIVSAPSLAAAASRGPAAPDSAQLQRQGQLALLTAKAMLKPMAQVPSQPKHLLILISGATAAATLQPVAPAVPQDAPNLPREFAELADVARQAQVTIHVMSPSDVAGSAGLIRRLK